MSAVTRPVLRYYGGKFRLAAWIIGMMPPHRFYVEPFGGAANVLMAKHRSYGEIYNDLDGEIVNVFRVLRDRQTASRLEQLVRLTPYARMEFDAAFYECADDCVEQARRTLVKSFFGFGPEAIFSTRASDLQMRTAPSIWTGMRAARRRGTTPASDWARYPKVIEAFTERLAGVLIEHREATEVLHKHDGEDTLHYVDPPYVLSTRSARHGYRCEMDDEAHRVLAEVLRGLKGMVMLSGYPSPLYDELYGDWTRLQVPHLAQGAVRRTEVLWMNHAATAQTPRLFAAGGAR